MTGKFTGQKLSELSDEELALFLRRDAQFQTRDVLPNMFFLNQPFCPDLSHYWFAKYELERRQKTAGAESASSFTLGADETKESIAQRLLKYGYRIAARKYHPDAGGATRSMQQLTAARDYALERLK